MLGLLLGCGLRRSEVVGLNLDQLQSREGHWVIVNLIGKGGRLRTVPVPWWCKELVDAWLQHSGVTDGKVFRRVLKGGILRGAGVTVNVVRYAVKPCAGQAGISNLAPHDLRRTCARLCHGSGGELEQIQFLFGYASVQTTERYIGSKQKLQDAVNAFCDRKQTHPIGGWSEALLHVPVSRAEPGPLCLPDQPARCEQAASSQ